MGFFNKMNKIKLPDTKEIVAIPTKIKQESKNFDINKITVRYFNQDFSKVIETIGNISHRTSIPIVYFDSPEKLAVIMFDDTAYNDITRGNMLCIDVCESYAYGLSKNTSLFRDLNILFYNDSADKKLGDKAKLLHDDTGCGYHIPVLLNNIPIPVVEVKEKIPLKIINTGFIEKTTTITQNLIRQLSDIKLLERVGKKDNSALMFCALLFTLIGGIFGIIIGVYIS